MGLTDEENYFVNTNYTDQQKNNILNSKLKYNYKTLTAKDKYGYFIFKGFKDIPFKPKPESVLNKDDIYFQSKLAEPAGMGGFVVRNNINKELFIYLSGSYYDEYTVKGGPYTK